MRKKIICISLLFIISCVNSFAQNGYSNYKLVKIVYQNGEIQDVTYKSSQSFFITNNSLKIKGINKTFNLMTTNNGNRVYAYWFPGKPATLYTGGIPAHWATEGSDGFGNYVFVVSPDLKTINMRDPIYDNFGEGKTEVYKLVTDNNIGDLYE